MIQGYFVRLMGLWNLYIMNKALEIQPESWTWLLGHDCVKRLTVKILAVLYKWFPLVYNGCIGLDYIFI